MTQKVESKPCDICGERSTSYSSGHGRWCDKHSPLPNFNPDLKGRREEVKQRIRGIIWDNFYEEKQTIYTSEYTFVDHVEDVTEKILSEIEK